MRIISGKRARWLILNFAFFAKFRVGILKADPKPVTGCERAPEIESESTTRKRVRGPFKPERSALGSKENLWPAAHVAVHFSAAC